MTSEPIPTTGDDPLLPPSMPGEEIQTGATEIQRAASEPTVRRPTLSELALGGALLVGDNVGTRLQVPLGEGETATRTIDMVLRPAAEWDNAPPSPMDAARHVTIGMLIDGRSNAGRIGHFLYDTTGVIARELDRISRPIRRSRPFRPLRRQFHRYQQRGEQQVARWSAMGRQEETRSRTIAETSLGSFVQRSVSDLTESEQVQVLVQQVVESQSTGLIGEFVEEVRERMVSLDILLSRRAQTSTYAPAAAPPFRAAYLRGRPHLTAIPALDQTLAGQYAGFASRVAALLIDITLLLITLSLATSFINAVVSLFNLNFLINRFMASQGLPGTVAAAIAGLSGMIVVAVYGIVGWSLNGVTVGNLVMGVRVIKADGGRVSSGRAATRMIGAYFSALLFFLGFIWVIFDKRRQGWHDKLAGTVVVYDWPAVPDDQFLREQLRNRGFFSPQ
jgi:uncharacterized RDD family membrane protein YckC